GEALRGEGRARDALGGAARRGDPLGAEGRETLGAQRAAVRRRPRRQQHAGTDTVGGMESATFGSSIGGLVAIAVLVLANAYFVATEFALVAVRKTQTNAWVAEGPRGGHPGAGRGARGGGGGARAGSRRARWASRSRASRSAWLASRCSSI